MNANTRRFVLPSFALALLFSLLVGFLSGCASMDETISRRLVEIEFGDATDMKNEPLDRPLTLKAAIERALEHSEEAATLRAAMHVADELKLAAADSRDPELRFGYGEGQLDSDIMSWDYDRLSPVATTSTQTMSSAIRNDTAYSVALRVFPQNPFERHYRISAASANSRAAAAELWHAEWRISIEARKLFAEIARLENEMSLLDQLVATQRDTLNVTRNLMERGQATMQDVMISSRQYLASLSDRDATGRDLDLARETLAAYAGLPANGLEIMVDETTFPNLDIGSADPEKLAQAALENRLDLLALHWRALAAQAAYREGKSACAPWFPQIQASYNAGTREGRSSLGSNLLGLDPDLPSGIQNSDTADWSIDAGLTIPIFSLTKNHADDALLAEYRQARLAETQARKKVYRDVVNTLDSLRSIQKSQLNYRAETAPIIFDMQETLDNAESATGLPPDEIAKIKREILQAGRLRIQAEYQFRMAAIRLEEVLGAPYKKSRTDAKSQ